MRRLAVVVGFLLINAIVFSQTIKVKGYVFDEELKNRMDDVIIKVYSNDSLIDQFQNKNDGSFEINLPQKGNYVLKLSEEAHIDLNYPITTGELGETLAIAMKRFPGYEFIGTIKEFVSKNLDLGDEISNTRIEVYNYTRDTQMLDLNIQPKSTFKFIFKSGYHYTVMIRKKGYFTKRFDVIVNAEGCTVCTEGLGNDYDSGIIGNASKADQRGLLMTDIGLRPIQIDEAIELENIYYDYNKWNIRQNARPSLDRLVQIMRTTPIKIELGSHTDSRGKDKYNMELSQRRAESAVNYIISRGIDKKRIVAQGYGETMLVNECSDGINCSEEEHQKNRRTEFKVTQLITARSFDNKSLKDIVEIEKNIKRKAVEDWEME